MSVVFVAMLSLSGVRAPEAVTLKLNPRVGTTFVYENTSENISMGKSSKMASTITMKVLQSDGKRIKLQSVTSKVRGDMPGAKEAEGMKYVTTSTPQFKFLDVKVEGGGQTGEMVAKSLRASLKMTPEFPKGVIKVGESWTMTVDFAEVMGAMSPMLKMTGDSLVVFKMTLSGVTTKNSKKLATLRTTAKDVLNIEGNGIKLKVDFMLDSQNVVDVATGMNVSTVSTTTQKMSGSQGGGTIVSKSRMNLIKVQ